MAGDDGDEETGGTADGEAGGDDGPPTLDAGRAGQAALLGATVAVLAALLPWVHRPIGSRSGLDLFGPLTIAVAVAVFAAILVGEWTTGTKLVVGGLGIGLVLPAFLVFLDVSAVPTDSPGSGLFLTLLSGVVVALAGSMAVLGESPGADGE